MGQVSPPPSEPKRLRTITPPPPFQAWAQEVLSLEEAGPDLAVVFWRVLRKVRDWAETAQEERAALFDSDREGARERLGEACARAPGLVEAFGTFAQLVRAPEQVEARRLAEACHQVYAWAEERSLLKVAMLFAEASAVAEPENPAWANDAGRMCRRAARDERASSWYHRGYGLGVRYGNTQEVIRAQLGYGNLMKDLGNHEEARRYFERAATRAIHTGRKRQAAEAHHDLLTISAETGAYASGERHVRMALDLYPINHPQFPALAHDWAFLLVRCRYYAPALALLELTVRLIPQPEFKTVVWSTLARAVAGGGMRARFDEIEPLLLDLIGQHQEYAPAALVNLGEGARAFGQWEKAEQFARSAETIARSRNDRGAERAAAELLAQIAAREIAPAEVASPNRERLETLALRFTSRLRRWKAPGSAKPGAIPPSDAPSPRNTAGS